MKIKKIDWSSEKSFYALAQFAFGALLSISKFDFKSNYLIIFNTHSLLMLFYSNFFFHFNWLVIRLTKVHHLNVMSMIGRLYWR